MKVTSLGKFIAKLVISILVFQLSFTTLSARRSYNPKLTKKRAIEMIRIHSEEVSALAGLDPLVGENILIDDIEDESELLSDSEFDEKEAKELEVMENEDEQYTDVDVNLTNFEKQWLSYVSADEEEVYTENGIRKEDIMESIMSWLGTPYRFGGTSRKSIDCSAFTQSIFEEVAEVKIPRTARWQFNVGEKIENISDLQFGDLIFFHTRKYAYASHCGIYLGDNLFAHASSRYGVTVSSLESGYYNQRFIGGRRLSDEDIMQFSIVKEKDEEPSTNFGG